MTLPALSPTQRREALEKATAVRKKRSEILAQLKSGRLAPSEILHRDDTVSGKILVRQLLQSLPGIGKVRARQYLEQLEIPENRRIQGLGAQQKKRLLALLSSTP